MPVTMLKPSTFAIVNSVSACAGRSITNLPTHIGFMFALIRATSC